MHTRTVLVVFSLLAPPLPILPIAATTKDKRRGHLGSELRIALHFSKNLVRKLHAPVGSWHRNEDCHHQASAVTNRIEATWVHYDVEERRERTQPQRTFQESLANLGQSVAPCRPHPVLRPAAGAPPPAAGRCRPLRAATFLLSPQ